MFERSPLDEARFGVRTAWARHITSATLPDVMRACAGEKIQLLMARCSAADFATIASLEDSGFHLMDVLVSYRRALIELPSIAVPDGMSIRSATPADESQIEQVARESFAGYQGHYHADPRLDRAACDAVYSSWAVRSLSRDVAAQVLVIEKESQIAGFATLGIEATEGIGQLFGVSPDFRRHGLYRLLIAGSMHWFARAGLQTMRYSTQITNLPAQNVLIDFGFHLFNSNVTFHKWFD